MNDLKQYFALSSHHSPFKVFEQDFISDLKFAISLLITDLYCFSFINRYLTRSDLQNSQLAEDNRHFESNLGGMRFYGYGLI